MGLPPGPLPSDSGSPSCPPRASSIPGAAAEIAIGARGRGRAAGARRGSLSVDPGKTSSPQSPPTGQPSSSARERLNLSHVQTKFNPPDELGATNDAGASLVGLVRTAEGKLDDASLLAELRHENRRNHG
jgi:hypothetical protein